MKSVSGPSELAHSFTTRRPVTSTSRSSGGVWKTTNNGTTFEPVFDGQPALSIGAIDVAPSDANIVWVGTGEAYSARSSYSGDGVYKSVDAGKTWQRGMVMSEDFDRHISQVVAVGTSLMLVGESGTLAITRPDISTQVRFRKEEEMRKGADALRADGFKGDVKILTSCPSCLQGLSRYNDDSGTDADYIVVEMAKAKGVKCPARLTRVVSGAPSVGFPRQS